MAIIEYMQSICRKSIQLLRQPSEGVDFGTRYLRPEVRSIARFLGTKQACGLAMADLDSILFAEYNFPDKLPLCLIEAARDVGQEKSAGMVRNLAQMAGTPAYIALYRPAANANPSSTDWSDIAHFRIKRIWPRPEPAWRTLSPSEWAQALVQIQDWQLRRFHAAEAANDSTY